MNRVFLRILGTSWMSFDETTQNMLSPSKFNLSLPHKSLGYSEGLCCAALIILNFVLHCRKKKKKKTSTAKIEHVTELNPLH